MGRDVHMKLTATGCTDVGRQRAENEDTLLVVDELDLYIVCDGMGGHASGQVASEIAAKELVTYLRERRDQARTVEGVRDLLVRGIQHANHRVYVEGMKASEREGMGCTLVAAMPAGDEMVMAHVGDSRIYRLGSRGGLEQLTRDHSLLNKKIDEGEIASSADIASFDGGNVIVRALGMTESVDPEVVHTRARTGDVFLLCTDGLTDMVDDFGIHHALEGNRDDLDEAVSALVRMANDRGGKDNVTVLLVRVDEGPSDSPEMPFSAKDTSPTIPRISAPSDWDGDPEGVIDADVIRDAIVRKIGPIAVTSGTVEASKAPKKGSKRPTGSQAPTIIVDGGLLEK